MKRIKKGATTVNINCHVSKSETNQKTLILDYEGEKGSGFPLFHYARRGLAHITRTAEKAQRRREAVTDYFPKLAYILSDVVILLGNDDLASTDYLTRCREFALKANDGVSQMVHRPVLIIIQNKASLAQSQKYETITKSFFDIHGEEAEALRPFYSAIKCFCLPHREQMQRTRNGILDGHKIFHEQMAGMKEILLSIRNRNAERSLTHAQWLYLLQRVLNIVKSGKSVSLHTLLSEIVSQDGDETIDIARRCFVSAYSDRSIHSPEWFEECCQFAIRVMAHCLAAKAYHQRELMSDRIIHEQCETALEQLASKLDEFQPCETLYIGKGRSSENNDDEHPVFCYQHKGAHAGGHRTCQSVYGLTAWKEFLGWRSTDAWAGEFLSSTRKGSKFGCLGNTSIDDLSSSIKDLMNAFQQEPNAIYSAFTDLFTGRYCFSMQDTEMRVEFSPKLPIFSAICFCRPSKISISRDSNPTQQSAKGIERKFRRSFIVIIRLARLAMSSGSRCQICEEKLTTELWQSLNSTPSSTAFSFSPLSRETPDCTICCERKRDFLFIPCGHRGFCEECANELLRTKSLCPFCRSSVTGKQRVHDV